MATSEVSESPDRGAQPKAVAEEPVHDHHPGPRQYVAVAVVLSVATAVEVAWYYLDMPRALFIGSLLFLAFFKFSLVVLWFMHLRFDNPIFRRLFVTGVALAISVYMIVLTIFGVMKVGGLFITILLLFGIPGLAYLVRILRSPSRPAKAPDVQPAGGHH